MLYMNRYKSELSLAPNDKADGQQGTEKCQYRFHMYGANWTDAKQTCRDNGNYSLVVMRDREMEELLASMAVSEVRPATRYFLELA